MINRFSGMNISSTNPRRLVEFYKDVLQVPVIEDDPNYDGVSFGFIKDAPVFWIWDENKWGISNDGPVTFVFNASDLDELYAKLKEKDVDVLEPLIAPWGGKELKVTDPDGNRILILD